MEFVWVPEGCYDMGQREEEKRYLIKEFGEKEYNKYYKNELPRHKVCLDGFWMGKYEVTQGQWKQVMENNPSHFKKGNNYPVETVSWNDAKEFLVKLNAQKQGQHEFRLPTEAQWEYACRSGEKNERYCGGDDLDGLGWYDENSGSTTHPVGTKTPNGLGLFDMSGNVGEWCEDIYGSGAYSKHQHDNPIYMGSGSIRVYRGGSWIRLVNHCRSAYRVGLSPGVRDDVFGFRLLRTP